MKEKWEKKSYKEKNKRTKFKGNNYEIIGNSVIQKRKKNKELYIIYFNE